MDNYILGLARAYFATAQRGMTPQETAFAHQQPLYLVGEYVEMSEKFGLDEQRGYTRIDGRMAARKVEPPLATETWQNERRGQEEPIAG